MLMVVSDFGVDIKEGLSECATILCLCSDVVLWVLVLWLGRSGSLSYQGKDNGQ